MDPYLKDWLDVLQGMANDNTYKLAWARSIIEILLTDLSTADDEVVEIPFSTIAERMLKYYWNQSFFFGLKQSPNNLKPPTLYQITNQLIEDYKVAEKTSIPIWYDKAKTVLESDGVKYKSTIRSMVATLKLDVCHRFLNANKKQYPLYEWNKSEKWIRFRKSQILVLKDFGIILIQIINYRWAQLLEQFNRSPKIASKVRGSQDNKIRRSNLAKFKEILLQSNHGAAITDFYTNQPLDEKDISIDHFIPWSFMYSDDLWNLVITSKSNNSSKSNKIPPLETIQKLVQRNKDLLSKINDPRLKLELQESIEKDYVTRFYMDMIG
jgi:5-methylcytosine-specific restriction endonuclease McrA